MNCTNSLTDEELIQAKKEVEEEVFNDFVKKHPFYAFSQFILMKTPWGKVRNTIITFKMKGLREGCVFLWKKLLAKLGIIPDPFKKRWSARRSYADAQNMIQGKSVTR